MAAANNSSEKIDLLVYGPVRPILENGFSDQFVLHMAETRADLERLTPDVLAKTRGMAVTYHSVPADKKSLSHFPKLEIVASFGVGYDHIDAAWAGKQGIIVKSLGLRRIRHTVELKDTPATRGLIHKVRHLVEVSE